MQKNGRDADEFAEVMQIARLNLYVFSTKPHLENRRFSGLARQIRLYPSYPPNSRSILDLQKNGTDAEFHAVCRADDFAETVLNLMQILVQSFVQKMAHMPLLAQYAVIKRKAITALQLWYKSIRNDL